MQTPFFVLKRSMRRIFISVDEVRPHAVSRPQPLFEMVANGSAPQIVSCADCGRIEINAIKCRQGTEYPFPAGSEDVAGLNRASSDS